MNFLDFLCDISGIVISMYIVFIIVVAIRELRDGVSAREFLQFILSTSFSIVVLIILVVVLITLDQGVTIMVNLFWNPENMALTIISIGFLALVLSHYPDYVQTALGDDRKSYEWRKDSFLAVSYTHLTLPTKA